jgi:predicted NBD/HSP70 family sugar kinase
VVDDWIEDAANALARVARNTNAVIEFDRVLIDGELPRPLLERLVRRTEAQFAELPNLNELRPSFGAGHAGASAPAIGAAFRLVHQRYFSREGE